MEKQTQGLGLGGSREMGAALGLQAEPQPRARGGHTTWRLQGGMQAGCKNWL